MPDNRRAWIAWETQRRSITLSEKVGAQLFIFDLEHLGVRRYPISLWKTFRVLVSYRQQTVFVQNPSMLLAAFAAFCRPLLRYTLVVDRHSNFPADNERANTAAGKLLGLLSRYSIAHADLTIVTNRDIELQYVRPRGRGFILPDPYPNVPQTRSNTRTAGGPLRIFFVSSWAADEPIAEVMEACRRLPDSIEVRISGKAKRSFLPLLETKPANFIPTGFLTDEQYFETMGESDCVLAISTRPGTLCCGAYEAVAMGKPYIVNDEAITREYFSSGALYTNATVENLVHLFTTMIARREILARETSAFYNESSVRWTSMVQELNAQLAAIRATK